MKNDNAFAAFAKHNLLFRYDGMQKSMALVSFPKLTRNNGVYVSTHVGNVRAVWPHIRGKIIFFSFYFIVESMS